jgi:microcystin-dependent protein
MSEPFLAEIRIVGFNFAPRGWAFCDGQIIPINQNQSLYALLGTTYGGDGRTSFALPDLRSRTPLNVGSGYRQGQKGGAENVKLSAAQMSAHTHVAKATNVLASQPSPDATLLAAQSSDLYRAPEVATETALRSGTITNSGNGQSHNNMQPYTTVNYCIALQGQFPSRN